MEPGRAKEREKEIITIFSETSLARSINSSFSLHSQDSHITANFLLRANIQIQSKQNFA